MNHVSLGLERESLRERSAVMEPRSRRHLLVFECDCSQKENPSSADHSRFVGSRQILRVWA
jgi:hypothetical protein